MDFISTYNLEGLVVGMATFLIIGVFHPLVIKGEYYLGQKCNVLFLIVGVLSVFASIYIQHQIVSILLGVIAFSCFWSIKEVKEQKRRVERGWFPKREKK